MLAAFPRLPVNRQPIKRWQKVRPSRWMDGNFFIAMAIVFVCLFVRRCDSPFVKRERKPDVICFTSGGAGPDSSSSNSRGVTYRNAYSRSVICRSKTDKVCRRATLRRLAETQPPKDTSSHTSFGSSLLRQWTVSVHVWANVNTRSFAFSPFRYLIEKGVFVTKK